MRPIEPVDLRDHIVQLAARAVFYQALAFYAGKVADTEWAERGEVTKKLLTFGLCETAANETAANCRAAARVLTFQHLSSHS